MDMSDCKFKLKFQLKVKTCLRFSFSHTLSAYGTPLWSRILKKHKALLKIFPTLQNPFMHIISTCFTNSSHSLINKIGQSCHNYEIVTMSLAKMMMISLSHPKQRQPLSHFHLPGESSLPSPVVIQLYVLLNCKLEFSNSILYSQN